MTRRNEILISIAAGIVLFPLLPLFFYSLVKYETYLSMTTGEYGPLTRSSYMQFERGFRKVAWRKEPEWVGSLFCDVYGEGLKYHYLHASIFRMYGVGYILTPYGYFMASRLIRRTIKQLRRHNPSMNRYIKLKD